MRITASGIIATCLLLTSEHTASPPTRQGASLDARVRQFVRSYDAATGTPDSTSRFAAGSVSSGPGGAEAVVVYIVGRDWCGTGGCPLVVLQPFGDSFKVIGKIVMSRQPILALRRSTNGRRDLAVLVCGGGIVACYEAVIPFNGVRYPGNPTVKPAFRMPKGMRADTIIGSDAKLARLY